MPIQFRQAGPADIRLLTESRVRVLRAANQLPPEADLGEVERESLRYYREALRDGSHLAWLVFDGTRLIGTGGVSFFQVMPTWHNPSGKKAYIMNMYTDPAYRRMGIAIRTLDLLVRGSLERGITAISLEATEMGRPLYEKYGFVKMNAEMELPEGSLPDCGAAVP